MYLLASQSAAPAWRHLFGDMTIKMVCFSHFSLGEIMILRESCGSPNLYTDIKQIKIPLMIMDKRKKTLRSQLRQEAKTLKYYG